MPQTITYRNATLAYQLFGTGDEVLLAFHGYGKDAQSLALLANYCHTKYTVVSIDIFFHGESVWTADDAPTQKDWAALISQLLEAVGNPATFSVFGYSIGGQLATCTAWLFAARIRTVWLMAATGIGADGFYHLAVNTTLGNSLFGYFVRRPNFILKPLQFLTRIGLINNGLEAFITRKIDTEEKRALLYKRWRVLKNFGVYTQKLQAALNANNAFVLLVYGKKDNVVSYKTAKRFAKGFTNVELFLPNEGHHLLNDVVLLATAKYLPKK